jgi:large repetitive protein
MPHFTEVMGRFLTSFIQSTTRIRRNPLASQQINFTAGTSTSTDSTIIVDVAPNGPVITALVNTTGAPGSQITDHAQVEVSGTADPGTTVRIFDNGGNTLVGSGTTTSNGTFDIVTSALADGSYSLTATATDPAGVTGAASAAFNVTVDVDAGEQNALGVTLNGGNPIAGAIAAAVPFTVTGIESDDNGTVTFSDGVNTPVVVAITNGQLAPTANLSGLDDGPITVTLHLDTDSAGNSFTDVVNNRPSCKTVGRL